ncbi:MAG: hypothetical protein LBU92_02025, partial [Prevotellaceae bacterium]|nr:hypothetical protein [Prevotellaceae bacterium]
MKRLLTLIFCLSLVAFARAQEAAPTEPVDEDVIYFKDGGKLRGTVVGGNKKTGRIMLNDGNIMVYKKAAIKMLAKEPLEDGPNAKEDSIKMAKVAKSVIEEEKEAEREAKRREEEIAALQKMVEGNKNAEKKDDEGGSPFRLYSSLELLGGIGLSKLPAPNDSTPALNNQQRLTGFHYALGGRNDYFYIGLNVGLHQTYRNLSTTTAHFLASDPNYQDKLPTTLLSMPLGLDMRIEFAPKAGMSPYLGVNGGYALSLTEEMNSYVVFNPSLGFR